jgi:riboflavin synthase alpha subunit
MASRSPPIAVKGGRRFSINLIPHTVEVTTLKRLHPGARVNLEIDLIARYVERMLTAGAQRKMRAFPSLVLSP